MHHIQPDSSTAAKHLAAGAVDAATPYLTALPCHALHCLALPCLDMPCLALLYLALALLLARCLPGTGSTSADTDDHWVAYDMWQLQELEREMAQRDVVLTQFHFHHIHDLLDTDTDTEESEQGQPGFNNGACTLNSLHISTLSDYCTSPMLPCMDNPAINLCDVAAPRRQGGILDILGDFVM